MNDPEPDHCRTALEGFTIHAKPIGSELTFCGLSLDTIGVEGQFPPPVPPYGWCGYCGPFAWGRVMRGADYKGGGAPVGQRIVA